VESVKAAADVFAPVTGEVVAINGELADAPEKINEDAYGAWMFKLKPGNAAELSGLLDAAAYQAIAEADAH
jgi:glycine cleavage system H protein